MVQIKGDVEAREIAQVLLVHAGNQCFRGNAFLFGTQHDRRAVGIIGTDIGGVIADQVLEAHPHIGLDVFDQVTQVDGAVGVGQCRGNEQLTCHGRNFSRSGPDHERCRGINAGFLPKKAA